MWKPHWTRCWKITQQVQLLPSPRQASRAPRQRRLLKVVAVQIQKKVILKNLRKRKPHERAAKDGLKMARMARMAGRTPAKVG